MKSTNKIFIAYCFTVMVVILFASCLKNNDSTDNGPKAQVAITNYVVNGASFAILFDNATITPAPLSFGSSISTGSGAYVPFGAGLHNFKLTSGTDFVTDNSISLETGINYSLFLFDTLKNNRVKSWLLTDDLEAVDTIAKARFLQFIPGTDSLTIYLSKDTLLFGIRDTYAGNKPALPLQLPFDIIIPPGNYQLQLVRNNTIIFRQASVNMLRGKLYSFITRGTINGTGVYKESVSLVQHN